MTSLAKRGSPVSVDQHKGGFHSPEIALLKEQNDISTSVHSGQAVALTMLGLSEAFDKIDHSILQDCLRDWFVDDSVLM